MSRFRLVDPNAPADEAAAPLGTAPAPDAFDAAVTMARADGARHAILIWLDKDGDDVRYRSIDAPAVLMRGMLEEARDVFLAPAEGGE